MPNPGVDSWIEDFRKVLEKNKGQLYVSGTNDCDHWGEKTALKAGAEMQEGWNTADEMVRQYIKKMTEAGTASPIDPTEGLDPGAHGVMMQHSKYLEQTGHYMTLLVNEDGTVDIL